jgi:hypothetical protein
MRQLRYLLSYQRGVLTSPSFTSLLRPASAPRLLFATPHRLEYNDSRFASLDSTPDGYIYENDEIKALLDMNYRAQKAELKGRVTLSAAPCRNGSPVSGFRHAASSRKEGLEPRAPITDVS